MDSIGALGSTGSYAYLSREERARRPGSRSSAAGGVPVMVGIGAVRTEHVIAHAHDAQAAGAAAVMLAPVSYQPLTEDEVYGLFADVTAELSVPLCVYDNPGTTHFTFSDDLHARVAALPGVRAIKLPGEGAADRIGALRPRVAGASRSASAATSSPPRRWTPARTCGSACSAGCSREAALAIVHEREAASARLEPLWALFRRHGGVRVVATAAALLGLAGERNLPRPLRLLDGDARVELEAALRALELTG